MDVSPAELLWKSLWITTDLDIPKIRLICAYADLDEMFHFVDQAIVFMIRFGFPTHFSRIFGHLIFPTLELMRIPCSAGATYYSFAAHEFRKETFRKQRSKHGRLTSKDLFIRLCETIGKEENESDREAVRHLVFGLLCLRITNETPTNNECFIQCNEWMFAHATCNSPLVAHALLDLPPHWKMDEIASCAISYCGSCSPPRHSTIMQRMVRQEALFSDDCLACDSSTHILGGFLYKMTAGRSNWLQKKIVYKAMIWVEEICKLALEGKGINFDCLKDDAFWLIAQQNERSPIGVIIMTAKNSARHYVLHYNDRVRTVLKQHAFPKEIGAIVLAFWQPPWQQQDYR